MTAASAALGARLALAGSLPHPPMLEPHRPSFFQDPTHDAAFRHAVAATVRANKAVGSKALSGAKAVAGIFVSDLKSFWTFLTTRLTLSPRLEDNPFIVAHKEAFIVGPRAEEGFDLDWAIPEELKPKEVWRASVASLPPASLRGTRAAPEDGVAFVGWPPKAAGE